MLGKCLQSRASVLGMWATQTRHWLDNNSTLCVRCFDTPNCVYSLHTCSLLGIQSILVVLGVVRVYRTVEQMSNQCRCIVESLVCEAEVCVTDMQPRPLESHQLESREPWASDVAMAVDPEALQAASPYGA